MQFIPTLVTSVIGIASGAVGYFVVTFWMKPLLQYLELRSKTLTDLIFYANVHGATGLVEDEMKRGREGQNALRRDAAQLLACFEELPWFYRAYLSSQKRDLQGCAEALIGLTNTLDFDAADTKRKYVLKHLGASERMKSTL